MRFDAPTNVQVFEATIRVLGGLLAAHLVLRDTNDPFFARFHLDDYEDELLTLSSELGARLFVAFESRTGLPFPRVNLRFGMHMADAELKSVKQTSPEHVDFPAGYRDIPPRRVEIPQRNVSCPAGVGSLSVEFGTLSRLIDDPTYELAAKRAMRALLALRSNATGLLGNAIDVTNTEWIGRMAGIGAGLDSFYEYLLKTYILFGIDSCTFGAYYVCKCNEILMYRCT